jgi:Protein of unknown function (DUF1007)
MRCWATSRSGSAIRGITGLCTTTALFALFLTLPFAAPLVAQPGKDLTILALDPTYFIAFEFAKTDPVKLSGSKSQSCMAAIAELAEGSPEAQRLSTAFAELGPNLGYTQIASISCTALAPQ